MGWINEVEMPTSVNDLKTSRSVFANDFPHFETLGAKIASSLKKIIQNSNFRKQVYPEEQKAQKDHRFLRGRQIAVMKNEYLRVTGTHVAILDFSDLFGKVSPRRRSEGGTGRWNIRSKSLDRQGSGRRAKIIDINDGNRS